MKTSAVAMGQRVMADCYHLCCVCKTCNLLAPLRTMTQFPSYTISM